MTEDPSTVLKPVESLAKALAEKGTPGIIFLGLIAVLIWAPALWSIFRTYGHFKDTAAGARTSPIWLLCGLPIICAIIAGVLTSSLLTSIVPTIKAETDAKISNAMGARFAYTVGRTTLAIDPHNAKIRATQIMQALVECSRTHLGLTDAKDAKNIRANIFILRGNDLIIPKGFHVNMEKEDELTITIRNGYLSTGMAYKHHQLVWSEKKENAWPHLTTSDGEGKWDPTPEVKKAHENLKWIISMPIPFQVQPFTLTAGVLNVDGLSNPPSKDQLQALARDISAAAALIGVLDRGSGFLSGEYVQPVEPSEKSMKELTGQLISPKHFDPASCPEPSKLFTEALGKIDGFEAFKEIPPAALATFLRAQLRN